AGGYGFGLGITETCSYGHVVAHSGGLPGFGSQMRWLPEYGVGIIAMGNRTYTGWGGPCAAALDLLDKSGGLEPRQAAPSAALIRAKEDVSNLVVQWDDALADRIVAVNLYLDRSKDRRRREFAEWRAKMGTCEANAPFTYVENALRGRWTLSCERGTLGVAVTLAPTDPPTVQFLEIGAPQPVTRSACRAQ
nr:serine hydrolase [Acidobacteriota bacterium]